MTIHAAVRGAVAAASSQAMMLVLTLQYGIASLKAICRSTRQFHIASSSSINQSINHPFISIEAKTY